jgi:hypothetical protein
MWHCYVMRHAIISIQKNPRHCPRVDITLLENLSSTLWRDVEVPLHICRHPAKYPAMTYPVTFNHLKMEINLNYIYRARLVQAGKRPFRDWKVRGSNPGRGGGGEIFRTPIDRPRGPPSLLYNGYRVFPGGKATKAWR